MMRTFVFYNIIVGVGIAYLGDKLAFETEP